MVTGFVRGQVKLTITSHWKHVVTAENLERWIEWLDRQEGLRGDSYRLGLAAGQAMVQENLNAKGVALDPMDLNKYRKSVSAIVLVNSRPLTDRVKDLATVTRAQANLGVRLVDNDGGVDDGIRAAAGGLESIINGNTFIPSSNIAPNANHQTVRRTRGNGTPSTSVTPTPGGAATYQSRSSSSWARHQRMIFFCYNSSGSPTDSQKWQIKTFSISMTLAVPPVLALSLP